MTTTTIAERLADGTATRQLIFSREAWFSTTLPPKFAVDSEFDEWGFAVRTTDNGTLGEWRVTWYDYGTGEVWRLQLFGDGFAAFKASGLLDVLSACPDGDQATLRAALAEAGWADVTPRAEPDLFARERPR